MEEEGIHLIGHGQFTFRNDIVEETLGLEFVFELRVQVYDGAGRGTLF